MSDLKERLILLMNSGQIELVSTHARLSFPIIERMYRKMVAEVPFTDIQVAGSAIINGHHRYLAALLANYQLSRAAGIRSEAKLNVDWKAVILEDADWDLPGDVERFNAEDARYCGMGLGEFLERIK